MSIRYCDDLRPVLPSIHDHRRFCPPRASALSQESVGHMHVACLTCRYEMITATKDAR